jgi:quercetin dioxygenase-like cupin family protein
VRSIRLDEISGGRWKPIRSTLGIRAFGVNAVVGDAGQQLIPEHDETEAGAGSQRHEELYVVLSGRATFVCGGQTLEAPTGTLVFIEDPAERRAATAEEDGTAVLAVGGPVGEPYRVAPWEYWFRVRAAREQGGADDAEAILAEGLAAYPDDPTLRRLIDT